MNARIGAGVNDHRRGRIRQDGHTARQDPALIGGAVAAGARERAAVQCHLSHGDELHGFQRCARVYHQRLSRLAAGGAKNRVVAKADFPRAVLHDCARARHPRLRWNPGEGRTAVEGEGSIVKHVHQVGHVADTAAIADLQRPSVDGDTAAIRATCGKDQCPAATLG